MVDKNGGNWFDDDPEWMTLRQRVSNQKPPKATPALGKPMGEALKRPQAKKDKKNIKLSLDISLPHLPKTPKLRRKELYLGLAVMLVIVLGLSIAATVKGKKDKGTHDVLGGTVQEPEFDTILPEGKKENTAGGEIGYDEAKKVVSFTDTIGNVSVTVSQQPLPDSFKAHPDDEVKKLAESFSANEVISESSPKAYLGTSVKGPQTVIFQKQGLLVFIQSDRSIEKSEWATYITKLL